MSDWFLIYVFDLNFQLHLHVDFLFFSSFSETLELADDMAIDIPHVWLYLAELSDSHVKRRANLHERTHHVSCACFFVCISS